MSSWSLWSEQSCTWIRRQMGGSSPASVILNWKRRPVGSDFLALTGRSAFWKFAGFFLAIEGFLSLPSQIAAIGVAVLAARGNAHVARSVSQGPQRGDQSNTHDWRDNALSPPKDR